METASVLLDRPSLPVLAESEVVVAGGSFAGIAAALSLAQAGRQVLVVEPRTYLGREVTATLRPWFERARIEAAPAFVRTCVDAAGVREEGNRDSMLLGDVPLHLDALKRCLEDLLLEAGTDLIYGSLPLGVLAPRGRVEGLVIGNKSGRQVVRCQTLIDATAAASAIRAAGAPFARPLPRALYQRTLELTNVGADVPRRLSVPPELGVHENRVTLRRGYRGSDHVLVECPFMLDARPDLRGATTREVVARELTMALAVYLIARVPAFEHAFLAAASHELQGAQAVRMSGAPPAWAAGMGLIRLDLPGLASTPLSMFAGPAAGMWALNAAARLAPIHSAYLEDPLWASQVGALLAEALPVEVPAGEPLSPPALPKTLPGLAAFEPEAPQRGRSCLQQPVPALALPVVADADVLVVGGGTSGATAAQVAAGEGMVTALVEMNPGLGGTGTLGGVDSYWFGRQQAGFAARVSAAVEQVHELLDYEGRRWNVEAKQYALLQQVERQQVDTLFHTLAIGALVRENRVWGIVAATRYGLVALLGRVVIDATGDGDVAAFAGAQTTYGDARDHVTMWYSLAQFVEPGRSQNNFTSMVDVSNVRDVTRAILAGRRRGGDCYDHGIYVAPRESRHVVGEVMLSLSDQLLHRHWPDVVNVHFSNHDIKGQTGSNWLRLGLIPPNLEIEIPYRALLPRGLEGMLVVGKALSATHDALPAIRMQADLENLGGVAGLAAAQAVREGVLPHEIDLSQLQQRLISEGLLPAGVLERSNAPRQYGRREIRNLIAALDPERPLYAYSDMEMDEVYRDPIPVVEIWAAGDQAVPFLERALRGASGQRALRLAQVLALLGSPAGVPVLAAEIEAILAGDGLPAREAHIRHANLPPDQGAMPDVVYLIYALGMARDRRALPVWSRVADLLDLSGLRDPLAGTFYYVDAVCFGAERLGDPAAVPILSRLHAYPAVHDQVMERGFEPDPIRERQAMLELAIGRALARCGGPEGAAVLIAYLDDNRALLAEQAHDELIAISGQDRGKDAAAWRAWLAEQGDALVPVPVGEGEGG